MPRERKQATAEHDHSFSGPLGAMRQLPHGFRRRVAVFVATVMFALAAWTSVASADHYYGWNNLTPSFPALCTSAWGGGCAQSGFNNWDWSEIGKNNGDWIALGFWGSSGAAYYNLFGSGYNTTWFHVTRSGLGAPTYNAAFCAYDHGNSSYVNCNMYIVG
jgi:hypothetical protein